MNESDMQHHVLVALGNHQWSDNFSRALTAAEHTVVTVSSPEEARAALRREPFDVALVDGAFTESGSEHGLALSILRTPNHPEVVVVAERANVTQAVALAKAGAFDYVSAPVTASQITKLVQQAGQLVRSRVATERQPAHFDDFMKAFLVSSVPAVQEMAALSRMVAAHGDTSALILGEPGAGKHLVARMIHWLSPQSRAPLVSVNLVDVAPEDLEATLFGKSEGHTGLMSAASGGTLLLQEISELGRDMQPKLLSVLETRKFRPLVGTSRLDLRARVPATTARDVGSLATGESLDAALFYRLASVIIRVPPLRERAVDIPAIAKALLAQVATDAGRPELRLSNGAEELLMHQEWPGNLRELRNVLTRLALLSAHDEIGADELLRTLVQTESVRPHHSSTISVVNKPNARRPRTSSIPVPRISGVITAALDETSRAERDRIEAALESAGGHRERAATMLGMSRTTLWTRMRMLGIHYERFRRSKVAQ